MPVRFRRGLLNAMIVTCFAAAALPETVRAQDVEATQRIERQLREFYRDFGAAVDPEQPISERLFLDYGAILRFGFYAIDDSFGNTRILRQPDAILYARAELDGAHRFYGRLQFMYNDWNKGDSFDGRGDRLIPPIGERYWYQFDLRNAIMAQTGERTDFNFNAKVGRQFVHWGSGMTLSNVLHAALLDAELYDVGLTGLIGQTPTTRTFDFDRSRPNFDRNTRRLFFGGQAEYRGNPQHRPYVFFLGQRDRNNDEVIFTGGPVPIPTRFDYDSNYVGVGSRGGLGPNVFYRVEGVYQFGKSFSNSFDPATGLPVSQTRERISAAAGIAGLTYLFRDEWNNRLDLEVIAGTGDSDRLEATDTLGGNRSGTRDHSFIALGYVNTGLVIAPQPSNLLSLRLGYSTSPPIFGHRRPDALRLGINGFLFNKIDSDAPISIASTDDRFIGGEIDLFLDWRISSDVSFNMRYGVFFPGDAIPDRQDTIRHFVFAGITYAF